MVIAFGNQKGGCGKSTLCVHFAHYLVAKKENVVVIDADFQETIVKARNQDLKQMEQNSIEVEKEPFGVMGANPNSIAEKLDFLFEENGKTVIIECKASNNRATSMKFVLANPKRFGVHPAVKIADTNVGTTNDFDTLPLYSLGFIQQEKKAQIVEMVDVTNLKVPEQTGE